MKKEYITPSADTMMLRAVAALMVGSDSIDVDPNAPPGDQSGAESRRNRRRRSEWDDEDEE